jgi:hypothetical protein
MEKRKRKQDLTPKSDPDENLKKQRVSTTSYKNQILTNSITNEVVSAKTVKPIFVSANFQVTKNALLNVRLDSRPTFKIRNANQTQISCGNSQDKQSVLEVLKNKQIQFHTFAEQADKPLRFTLKGFYETSCDELTKILVAQKLPVIKSTILFKNQNCTFYIVQFKPESAISVAVLNRTARIVDDVAVRWEPYKSSKPQHTQCRKCQRWGHSAIGCGYNYRCVKCSDIHEVGKCPRTTRDGLPSCVNCGGEHTANHRGCKVFKVFESKVVVQKAKQAKTKKIIESVLKESEFPQLPSISDNKIATNLKESSVKPTFAESLSQNTVSSQIQNEKSVQNRLLRIQKIVESSPLVDQALDLFEKLIQELIKVKSQSKDIQISLKLTPDNIDLMDGS